jgi:putative membrane-bound dehydrogenase-like protein
MKRSAVCLLVLFTSVAVTSAQAGDFKLNGRTFTLPDGFEIELVAGQSLVDRPITADFDEEGRLYVSDSSGSNDKVEKQLAERPHRILRLEDTDGDGRMDRRTVFADKMMFPEGTMWLDGSLYVSAPPSIWKLTDTDGDGVADQRVEWFQGKTLTGCANDLHGPYPGPDGWIYWCKGAFAKQTYERPGKPPFVTRAAHIFRARPDGTGIEPVMTGGMDNPVDVVFTPGGERIFTTTFLQHPGGGRRDGLIHAIYGGVYGKVHDVIDEHPHTSPDVMPVLVHLGAAAPCGLTRYESDVFGPEYRDNLFASLFNMHKITRHVLTPAGASYTARDEDFLVSADLDFHPTDIQADADGSLVVVDTGGWYKLCCPTSQLVKPDVLGAVYRVRKKGAPAVADPRGTTMRWGRLSVTALVNLLDDPRPAVRARATASLAKLDAHGLATLDAAVKTSRSPETRRNALWAATRIEAPEARAVARAGLSDSDETVRQVAIHSASVRVDRDALPALLGLLKGSSAANRRAAAEALGRIGDRSAVPGLLAAAAEADPADRALEHSLTYALIEIADPKGTAAGLSSQNPRARRAALTALDQMPHGQLAPEAVAPLLTASDSGLRETAAWIVGHHPEWGAGLAGFLRDRLAAKNLTQPESAELERQLASFAGAKQVQDVLAEKLRDSSASPAARMLALRAMAQSGLKEVPQAWIGELTRALTGDDPELSRQAVTTTKALPIAKDKAGDLSTVLLKIAASEKTPSAVRLEALGAVPGGLANVDAGTFAFLRSQLSPDQAVSTRIAAIDVLSRSKLTAGQLAELTENLKAAGPLEVDRFLATFEQSTDDTIGLKILAALKGTPALAGLRVETLKPRLAKFGPAVQTQAEEIYATIAADAAKQKVRLEEILTSLETGDIRRGQAIFNGPKAACASCHAIGYLGGNVGPDLTRIAQIRAERDLLEAIVFPSASFVRSYEPVIVASKDGKVVSGVLRKDSADEVVLAIGANQEARFARDDIEEMSPGTVSVMPAGLDQQLTKQELADLLAFLKACK